MAIVRRVALYHALFTDYKEGGAIFGLGHKHCPVLVLAVEECKPRSTGQPPVSDHPKHGNALSLIE
jgi:hypothetical protein